MTDLRSDFELARAMAEVAQAINRPGTLEETLDAIAHAARVSVPGFDQVGVSVVEADGSVTTMASTGDLVPHMDGLQYKLGEGPCLSALGDGPLVLVEDLSREQRWPRYTPRAVEAGVRAQMGVQLFTHEETLGGLNFYSTASGTIDPDAPAHAAVFATHAALALGHARHEHDLTEAIETRQLIGQAVGMLVERYEITQDRAFHYLARVSSAGQARIRDVAREVVNQGDARAREATDPQGE